MKLIVIWTALLVLVNSASSQTISPPKPSNCDNGIVRMSDGVNGSFTLCSAIAEQVPALARQVAALGERVKNQSDEITELERLIRAANTLSRSLGQERQTKLLENIVARLEPKPGSNETHLKSHITSLADEMDDTQSQLLGALTSPNTAGKTAAALQGEVGDSISRLDFSSVRQQLNDITRQLVEMNGKLDKIAQTTTNINSAVQSERLSPPKIRAALEVADMSLLNAMLSAAVPVSVLQGELQARSATDYVSVARLFFQASLHSAEALKWLKAELDRGLDPNMTVSGENSKPEGLLLQALRAGNANAVKLLIHSGASPHAYQELGLSSYSGTMFLSPVAAVADNERFTREEKQQIVAAMLAAGAVVPEPHKTGLSPGPQTQMEQARQLQTTVAAQLGMTLPVSKSLCETKKTSICEQASRQTGEDWCGYIAAMPKAIRALPNNNSAPFGDVDLKYLLLIRGNSAFFLGLEGHQEGYQEYVLVEVSRDASSWSVSKFMSENFNSSWVSVLLHQRAGSNDLDLNGRELSWRMSRHGCDAPGLAATKLPTDMPNSAWSAQSVRLSPTRAGAAGSSTATLQNGSLLATTYRNSLLMLRDNPAILDQPEVLEDMTSWMLWGEPNFEFERYASDPLEEAGFNQVHPMFVYDWSELLKEDPAFAKGAALDVYLRPDLEWQFLQHTPGWDPARPKAWVGMFLFPREADVPEEEHQRVSREMSPILKEQLLLAAKRESTELWLPVDVAGAHYDTSSKKLVFKNAELLERASSAQLTEAGQAFATYSYGYLASRVGENQLVPGGYRTHLGELQRWRELTMLKGSVGMLALDRKLLLAPLSLDQNKAEEAIRQGLQARIFYTVSRVKASADKRPEFVMLAHVKFVEIRMVRSKEVIATITDGALPQP